MFPFNLLLSSKSQKKSVQGPKEIQLLINKMNRCSHCHFIIFDNYWSSEISDRNKHLCPTCGNKLS